MPTNLLTPHEISADDIPHLIPEAPPAPAEVLKLVHDTIPPLLKNQVKRLLLSNVPPEEIAFQYDIPLSAVKALQSTSTTDAKEPGQDYTAQEIQELLDNARALALTAESEDVRAKVTLHLIERAKPKPKHIEVKHDHITEYNKRIEESNAAYRKLLEERRAKIINV